jgi:hypothetical protein
VRAVIRALEAEPRPVAQPSQFSLQELRLPGGCRLRFGG